MKQTYVFPTVKAAQKFRALVAACSSALTVRRRGRTVLIGHAIYTSRVGQYYVIGAADALGGEER